VCELELREATIHDADVAVELVTAMLHEMAAHGGRALNDEGRFWAGLRERFLGALKKDDHVFLLAVVKGGGKPAGIVEASVRSTHEVFRPASVVHIHALYVRPRYRGEGLGRELLEQALTWGRAKRCSEATLSVLVGNPARGLYERAGFEAFELQMRRNL